MSQHAVPPVRQTQTPPFVLLDDFASAGAASWLFNNAVEIITTNEPGNVEGALHAIELGQQRGLHAAGYFSYELGLALELKLRLLAPVSSATPLLWVGLFEQPTRLTRDEVGDWLATLAGDYELSAERVSWSKKQYAARFATVKDMIASGDIYQLNLTFKTHFELTGSTLGLYRDLRARQPVAYGGIIETGTQTILSASPELFIACKHGNIETRPMKGTAPRAPSARDDDNVRRTLSTDPKQRAENLMIVDLMRNDLSRISQTGSVTVTDLFSVETLPTLHQMTSGIRATLNQGTTITDIMRAIFPAGSITGAPKIRAMELIDELEAKPRGAYCGAIGYIAPSGDAHLNVAIRTITVSGNGEAEMGIGSGVVYDSDVDAEYDECLLKMQFLKEAIEPFQLIETLLFEPTNGFWLLERHMDRLSASARHFGFACKQAEIRAQLEDAVAKQNKRLRVRLLLAANGKVIIATFPLPAKSDADQIRYIVSPSTLASSDPLLRHKTTRRALYDREWQHFHDTVGADEVIYLNEKGELAEGSRTNIFIERDRILLTPALDCGLLPGTLRAELLANGRAREAVLTVNDLESAARVFLGNSVRGLQPAVPITPENAR